MGDQHARRRGASRIANIPPALNEAGGMAELRLTGLSTPASRPGRPRKKAPLSMALIDPKPLTRQSLLKMLAKALPDYATIAVPSCEELLELQGGQTGAPRLVIVYIRSAGVTDASVQDGLELVRLRLPDAPLIVLSDRDDVDDVNSALSWGVRGYIPTSVESEVAFAALRLINAGGTFVPADALRSATAKPDTAADGRLRLLGDELDLTPRELSVLDLLREGKPNKLIAAQLKTEESTVKVHVRNILKKLHAANRTHAVYVVNRLLGERAHTTIGYGLPQSAVGAGSSSEV
jgi:DNA-binding NarL/FixJ family response regulator